ncbi:choice-of-anchor R domain-containing protein [Candidatus Palauibacter sp.]|uniref:choice-of-anchor R domain-containing protein n=1 Tax=Candidatus Palauibacter sp. TaxID=3101350 RepID=UPI003AF23FFA
MHALLVTLALLLPPGVAQAQEISLVSNITESHTGLQNVFPPDYTIGTIELGEKRNAQRFTTGSNPAGYTLQSVVLNLLEGSGTGQVVRVAIHDDGSSGNPGTLLAVLDSPADPIGDNSGTAGNRTFAAPSALSLNADTEYWVVVSNTTTDNSYFDISVTNSNNETTAHGFSIRDSRHGGTPGSWLEDNNTKLRMEVRGTVVIPTGLEVTLHLSDNEPHEDLLAVTVTATASPASPVAFTVEISASPVAPATDDDFELSTNRTLSFAANATGSTGTVRISPVSDEDPEPNDVVKVSGVVSNPAIPNPDDVRLTILNDDADLPQDIAIDAPAAVDEGAGTANVTVTLTTRQNTAPVIDAQLFYRQRPGTATRGDDYTRPQGLGNRIAIVPVSEFSANADGTAWVARHSFEIGIVDDGEAEADETIVFEIYIISDNRGTEQTIVIRDDDTPPAVSIAAANPTVLEEQPAVFTLSRTGATGSALTVTVALTEQADRDVLPDGAATQRTVTFARGSSTAALTVELENDDLTEPDGDLTAAVRAGAGYTVGDPSTATVTVVDDDGPTVPVIEDIEVVSTPRLRWRNSREEDTYGEGENIRIEVRFDQPVHVEGEPAMALEVGDPCGSVCEARYESGSGTDTLVFAYLVLVVEIDRNGVAIPANPIGGRSTNSTASASAATGTRRRAFPTGGRARRAATRWTGRGRRRRTCRWRTPRRTRPTARWRSRCAWSRTAWAS